MTVLPSPHSSVHSLIFSPLLYEQVKPGSTLQVESHPSPSSAFKSYHTTNWLEGAELYPAPQAGLHVSGLDKSPPLHIYPNSTSQSESHPSPSDQLVSSHSSPIIKFINPGKKRNLV